MSGERDSVWAGCVGADVLAVAKVYAMVASDESAGVFDASNNAICGGIN